MIKIEQLKNKIIRPVIEKYKKLIPDLENYEEKYYLDLSANLMVGTVLAESYGGYYICDEEYERNGIFGMTRDMLKRCVNDDIFPNIINQSIETAYDNLICDLNFATEMAFIFYVKSGAIEWLARESKGDPAQVSKMTKTWVNYYRNGAANPAKFYALYCKIVLNKHKGPIDSSRCNRCGYEDKKAYLNRQDHNVKNSQSDAVDYNFKQPTSNIGRTFNDKKHF